MIYLTLIPAGILSNKSDGEMRMKPNVLDTKNVLLVKNQTPKTSNGQYFVTQISDRKFQTQTTPPHLPATIISESSHLGIYTSAN